jgi:hypothetical protein
MMALANLLHHPAIGSQTMSGLIEGRTIKRSNKDLGRVLAIAYLSDKRQEDSLLDWPELWADTLQHCFPSLRSQLAARAGSGIRQILSPENEPDLDEARQTCAYGLLASRPPTLTVLRAVGRRLLQDAVEPLEKRQSK